MIVDSREFGDRWILYATQYCVQCIFAERCGVAIATPLVHSHGEDPGQIRLEVPKTLMRGTRGADDQRTHFSTWRACTPKLSRTSCGIARAGLDVP